MENLLIQKLVNALANTKKYVVAAKEGYDAEDVLNQLNNTMEEARIAGFCPKKDEDSIFGIGDHVNVTPMYDEDYDKFTGTVVEIRDNFLIVEDLDGDSWEVEPHQCSFCSDKYMHM